MATQAEHIIKKFGGPDVVAEILGVTPLRVKRWTDPDDEWGTEGRIPSKHFHKLLSEAKTRGIRLAPKDFFESAG